VTNPPPTGKQTGDSSEPEALSAHSRVSLSTARRLARQLIERWPEFTPRERRHLEALFRTHRKDLHGSYSGYVEHVNLWETACDACRQAASDARRQWAQRRRRQQGGGA
jgi:hypothetical protein